MEIEERSETIELNQPDEKSTEVKIDEKIVRELSDKLGKAVLANNRLAFRQILNDLDKSTCISALESYDPDSQMSVFEQACNSSSGIIADCITVGCDVNKQPNPKCGRRPINIAIERLYLGNVEALLRESSVSLDFHHSTDFPFTPVHYLVEQISDECFVKVFEYIELLVDEISKIVESNEAMQHEIQTMQVEIGSMAKTVKSIERMLEKQQENISSP